MKYSITCATHTMVVSWWCPTDTELKYCVNQRHMVRVLEGWTFLLLTVDYLLNWNVLIMVKQYTVNSNVSVGIGKNIH